MPAAASRAWISGTPGCSRKSWAMSATAMPGAASSSAFHRSSLAAFW